MRVVDIQWPWMAFSRFLFEIMIPLFAGRKMEYNYKNSVLKKTIASEKSKKRNVNKNFV